LTVIVQHENFERKEIYGAIFFTAKAILQRQEIALKALLVLLSGKRTTCLNVI